MGGNDDERVGQGIDSQVDLVVVDTAHGHSRNVLKAVERIKGKYDVDVVAGNVATEAAARITSAAASPSRRKGPLSVWCSPEGIT